MLSINLLTLDFNLDIISVYCKSTLIDLILHTVSHHPSPNFSCEVNISLVLPPAYLSLYCQNFMAVKQELDCFRDNNKRNKNLSSENY